MRAAILTLIGAGLLLAGPAARSAHAAGTLDVLNASFDVVVLRPLGVCATAVGGAMLVPAALVTSPSGGDAIRLAYRQFLAPPVDNTFKRKLGEF